MADSSLDQFFAKKDKNKKKTKGKVTSEQIAKKMADSGESAEKTLKKDKDKQENSSGKLSVTIPSLAQGEDEWNDFEEEKEVDYSGLRIQALTIAEKEKEEEAAREQLDEDEPEPKETRGTYRPPHLRSGATAAARTAGTQGSRRPVRQNYDFTSEEQFPTLGAATDTKAPRQVSCCL
ncbi:hypothetical protein HPB52_011050 [Rhipicephalus sanguineus]|uniref:Protein CDV3 homolog n=1 Tax=Rhipicephalus sanguineus TaxID=34632 RepID=A0A9D4SUD0_RHISA|nr:hypothetical protein HPB52_011050 [Rhipicephalus sanguineus]